MKKYNWKSQQPQSKWHLQTEKKQEKAHHHQKAKTKHKFSIIAVQLLQFVVTVSRNIKLDLLLDNF